MPTPSRVTLAKKQTAGKVSLLINLSTSNEGALNSHSATSRERPHLFIVQTKNTLLEKRRIEF